MKRIGNTPLVEIEKLTDLGLKYLLIIILLTIKTTGIAQIDSIQLKKKSNQELIPKNHNKPSAITLNNAILWTSNDIYVYNELKDTIYLSKIIELTEGLLDCKSAKVVDEIQIDNVGAKEVILYRKCSISIDRRGATFDISGKAKIRKYEIWNLDKKELLFEAKSFHKVRFREYRDFSNLEKKRSRHYYQYKFKIEGNGQIVIKHIRRRGNIYPDKLKGTYEYSRSDYKYQLVD